MDDVRRGGRGRERLTPGASSQRHPWPSLAMPEKAGEGSKLSLQASMASGLHRGGDFTKAVKPRQSSKGSEAEPVKLRE